MTMDLIIDLATPSRWRAEHFWRAGEKRVYGLVIAFCPTTFAIGGELFGSRETARGFALFLGPLWLGAATLRIADAIDPRRKFIDAKGSA